MEARCSHRARLPRRTWSGLELGAGLVVGSNPNKEDLGLGFASAAAEGLLQRDRRVALPISPLHLPYYISPYLRAPSAA